MPTAEQLVRLLDLQRTTSDVAVAQRRLQQKQAALDAVKNADTHPSHKLLLVAQEELEQSTRAEAAIRGDIDIATKRLARDEELIRESSDHKQIARLQTEQDRLRERIDELETQQLEVLEARDDVAARIESLMAEASAGQSAHDTERFAAETEVSSAQAAAAAAQTACAEVRGTVDSELLALFDEAKANNGLVGAERMVNRACPTTGLPLDPLDYDQIARAAVDEIVHCPECGAIIVKGSAA